MNEKRKYVFFLFLNEPSKTAQSRWTPLDDTAATERRGEKSKRKPGQRKKKEKGKEKEKEKEKAGRVIVNEARLVALSRSATPHRHLVRASSVPPNRRDRADNAATTATATTTTTTTTTTRLR